MIDMVLPKVGGLALFNTLRNSEETKDIPVLFMSGAIKDEDFQKEGIEMGAVDYITKPFNLESLKEKIENILQKNRD
jgi:DNA-binding response OmpR family regulator